MSATQAKAGGGASRPRSLFQTETLLRVAWDALAEVDPDATMTAEEADAFIAKFVNREAAVAARDQFGDFVREMEAFADAKEAEAARLKAEAARVRAGVERMKASAIRTMGLLGLEELRGEHRLLRIKRSRGAVEVVDEKAIPAEYWRVREDDDLLVIRKMREIMAALLKAISDGKSKAADEAIVAANLMVEQAEARRRVVNKVAIQNAWTKAGGDLREVDAVGFTDDALHALAISGRVRVDEKGEPTTVGIPVVPGVEKRVEITLDVK